MKHSQLSLEFTHNNQSHKITGLQLINIENNNYFWDGRSLINNQTHHNSLKSSCKIEMKGVFLNDIEQLLLQELSFDNRSFNGTISHSNFKIHGLFCIQQYTIGHEVNQLNSFKLLLESKNRINHQIITQK